MCIFSHPFEFEVEYFCHLNGKRKNPKSSYQTAASSKKDKQAKEDRFDALTRKFMFALQNLSKTLPDGSRRFLRILTYVFTQVLRLEYYIQIRIFDFYKFLVNPFASFFAVSQLIVCQGHPAKIC